MRSRPTNRQTSGRRWRCATNGCARTIGLRRTAKIPFEPDSFGAPVRAAIPITIADGDFRRAMNARTRFLITIAGIPLLWAAAALPAFAQAPGASYPTRPVKLVVPFPPGGPLDIIGRAIAQKLTESWGQSVVVDNRPGAGGNIGADIVAKSRAGRLHDPDGGAVDARGQPEPLREDALRRGQGLRADHAGGGHAERARRQRVAPGRNSRRNSSPTPRPIPGSSPSARAATAAPAISPASCSRPRPGTDITARPVQGRRAGDAGAARRRHAVHVRQPRQRDAAGQGGQAEGARGHDRTALEARARPADDGGSRAARASTSRRGSDCSRPPARRRT